MVQAVIFDLDGTLIDSVDLHIQAWKRTFERFGKEVSNEQIRRQIGKGADDMLPLFFSSEELDRFRPDLEKYQGELFKREYLPKVNAFPRVRELLQRLKQDEKKIALGLPPDQGIDIGDTAYDAEAAGKISLRSIGLLCGGGNREELQRAGCVAIYENPADLLEHYDASPLGSALMSEPTSSIANLILKS